MISAITVSLGVALGLSLPRMPLYRFVLTVLVVAAICAHYYAVGAGMYE